MLKQNQRRLSRPKTKKELSLAFTLFLALFVACAIGVGLWTALVHSVQHQRTGIITQSAAQNLRGKESERVSTIRKQAEIHIKQITVPKQDTEHDDKETLVLQTTIGDISIVLRPDLSPESVEYVRQMAQLQDCATCKLYRAETPGILQGIIANRPKLPINKIKGSCPQGYDTVKNDCPKWDKSCACHGPVRKRMSSAASADVLVHGIPSLSI
jgi:hypothetical protein